MRRAVPWLALFAVLFAAPPAPACDSIAVSVLSVTASPRASAAGSGVLALGADGFEIDLGAGPSPASAASSATAPALVLIGEEQEGDRIRFRFARIPDGVLLDPHVEHACGTLEGRLGYDHEPVLEARIGARTATLSGVGTLLDGGDPYRSSPLYYQAYIGDPVPFLVTIELQNGATWQPGIFAAGALDYLVRARFAFAFAPTPPGPAVTTLSNSAGSLSVYGTSADGGTVAGWWSGSGGPEGAARWSGDAFDLLPPPPGASYAIPHAVSPDGHVIVGTAQSPIDAVPVRWDDLVPTLLTPFGGQQAHAFDASDGGNVVVGSRQGEAARWNGGVLEPLGLLPGGSWSEALSVSADGSVVVGRGDSADAPAGEFEAFRWTAATGLVGLGALPGGDGASRANAVSDDGRVVVGASSSAGGAPRAFRWTQAHGMQDLCDSSACDGALWTEALYVSADGSVIAGDMDGQTFLWDAEHGFRLLSAGAQPVGLSADGLTLTVLLATGGDRLRRLALVADCANLLDDDGDGLVDADDPGCSDPSDRSERSATAPCDDGVDDDDDGFADVMDPACTAPDAPSEVGACQNGIDDDGDGLVDLADPGCSDAADASESSDAPQCANGIDDDGDGLVDLDDPGCPSPEASPENPECDDGIDNDGNGLVDFADPKCSPSWPYWETPRTACGLGAELSALLPFLACLHRRRRRLRA